MATWTNRGAVQKTPSRRSDVAAERPHILDRDSFQTMIALERKRSERSQRAYALVLVSLSDGLPGGKDLLRKIAGILASLARETDLIGWYAADSALGMIFTDIAGRHKHEVIPGILARLVGNLRERLTAAEFEQVSISMNCYPEDWRLDVPKRPSNPALYPDLVRRDQSRKAAIVAKRMMDIVGSTTALVLLAPVFLVIAIAIKLTSKGPVFFRQQRVGQHGKPFVMLKFRSMHIGNDTSVHEQWFHSFYQGKAKRHATVGSSSGSYKLPHDPRVTPVGRFLRRSSLDEAPQFINVLRGEMSLVGPRPPIPYEVDVYQAWHRGRVLQAKPGITGLWQVHGRSRVSFDEMVRLDLRYARTWSIWLDIKILLKTPAAVFFGEGAY